MKALVEWMAVAQQGSYKKQRTCKLPRKFPSLKLICKSNASKKILGKTKIKSEKYV